MACLPWSRLLVNEPADQAALSVMENGPVRRGATVGNGLVSPPSSSSRTLRSKKPVADHPPRVLRPSGCAPGFKTSPEVLHEKAARVAVYELRQGEQL